MRFSDVQEEEDGDGGGPSDPAATQLCEEGDLVREDLVAEAHAQRASKRQQNKAMNGEKHDFNPPYCCNALLSVHKLDCDMLIRGKVH